MIEKPMDVLRLFPIRRRKQQKLAFADAVLDYARKRGYSARVEEEKRGVRNIVIGEPDSAKYLITAHYDTPASIGIPNMIAPNNPVAFFLLQFAMVGILVALAVGIGFAAYGLGASEQIAYLAGYVFYMVLLILMMKGPANRHNANDNTSGVVTLLEILTELPENLRSDACFVLFDMEEDGLVGSKAFRNRHKAATENQVVLNMDCVGDGDIIQITPIKKAREDQTLVKNLAAICGKKGEKEISLRAKGFYMGNSDHKHFPKGVAIMAFRYRKGLGLYCDRIHTWRDTILDEGNVSILRDSLIAFLTNE